MRGFKTKGKDLCLKPWRTVTSWCRQSWPVDQWTDSVGWSFLHVRWRTNSSFHELIWDMKIKFLICSQQPQLRWWKGCLPLLHLTWVCQDYTILPTVNSALRPARCLTSLLYQFHGAAIDTAEWQIETQTPLLDCWNYLSMGIPWGFSRLKPHSQPKVSQHSCQVVLQ